MASSASSVKPKSSAKGLSGKLSKHKYIVAAVVVAALAVGYLWYKNRGETGGSAGTTASPSATDTGAAYPSSLDGTGGGATGSDTGAGTGDLSNLFGYLDAENQNIAGLVTAFNNQQPATFNFTLPSSNPASGGNVSVPATATAPTQPVTSTPASILNTATSGATPAASAAAQKIAVNLLPAAGFGVDTSGSSSSINYAPGTPLAAAKPNPTKGNVAGTTSNKDAVNRSKTLH